MEQSKIKQEKRNKTVYTCVHSVAVAPVKHKKKQASVDTYLAPEIDLAV